MSIFKTEHICTYCTYVHIYVQMYVHTYVHMFLCVVTYVVQYVKQNKKHMSVTNTTVHIYNLYVWLYEVGTC